MLRTGFKLDGERPAVATPPPLMGEHTDALLGEHTDALLGEHTDALLAEPGYGEADIAVLRAVGAV